MRLRGRIGLARVALLTITDDEFPAVQAEFALHNNIEGTPYFVTAVAPPDHQYDVILRQAAYRTNTPMAQAASRFIDHFRPEFFLLVGTAGGVHGRDGIALGDVVVPDYIDYCEFSKLLPKRNLTRKIPFDQPSLFLRESFADPLRRSVEWLRRIHVERPPVPQVSFLRTPVHRTLAIFDRLRGVSSASTSVPRVLVGSFVSGEKIWGDPSSRQLKHMLSLYDKALGFEMEAYGVASALFAARRSVDYNPQYLVIRGVSDLVNRRGNDETRHQWSTYAVGTATAFTYCLVQSILGAPRWD